MKSEISREMSGVGLTDHSNQICVVTGATSGVGKAMALGLADAGCRLILPVRDMRRGKMAKNELTERTANPSIELVVCDLSSQASIRDASVRIHSLCDRIDLLCQHASVLLPKRRESEDGIEMTWAVNVMSYFLFPARLFDLLIRGAHSRILNVVGSPGAMRGMKLRRHDVEFTHRYQGFRAFTHSVYARWLLTLEMSGRLQSRDIGVSVFYPGLVRTQLGRHLPVPIKWPLKMINPLFGETCTTGLYAALNEDAAHATGTYFVRRRARDIRPKHDDPTDWERVWGMYENRLLATGFKFPYPLHLNTAGG